MELTPERIEWILEQMKRKAPELQRQIRGLEEASIVPPETLDMWIGPAEHAPQNLWIGPDEHKPRNHWIGPCR